MTRHSSDSIKNKLHNLFTQHIKKQKRKFIPGKNLIPYAGAVFDEKELNAMTDVLLKGWFGLGKQGMLFEYELAKYLKAKKTYLVNSGSSADLLIMTALKSAKSSRPFKEGDEVITPACTFPTLISSLVHNRLKPVFVDVDLKTLNPKPSDIYDALSSKTKAIFLVHTLGNPNDMDPILKIARDKNLLVLEDNCDGLGSTYKGKKTGSFGAMSTVSFYPAHHITTAGEGGAVVINDIHFQRIIQSLRDWGRDCWCGASGGPQNGLCGNRFNYKLNGIPYDHKYIFSEIGYNLKPVELQAAMGRVQLKKLDKFNITRKNNFKKYDSFFKSHEQFFLQHHATNFSDPAWFAYPVSIKKNAPFRRHELTMYLEKHLIQTRPMFAGNILRQPGFKKIHHRISKSLANSDAVFERTFFIGLYPGITEKHILYIFQTVENFLKKYTKEKTTKLK